MAAGLVGIVASVEPIEVPFVVGNPFLDGLPRRLDGCHGLDIEWGRRRAGRPMTPSQRP